MSRNFDWIIFVCILILCSLGTVVIGSVAPELLVTQIIFYLVGIALFFLFSRIDYQIYSSIWKHLYVGSIILLLITLFLGFESRGATRWISIAGFRLQFSEILKPFLIASIGGYLFEKKNYISAFILGLIPTILIFKQPDLGSALVYLSGLFSLIFLSGISFSYILFSVVALITVIPVFWHFLADYQKTRILSFINPHSDPLGASYNAIQATIAVGSGMFFGWGLGRGPQSQLLFLPERHTDFIFATLAEELGFFGATMLLIVYFVLFWRILNTKNVLAVSLGLMILFQIFINIGMNMGIIPVTGITLPLVSYGGSSILATMIALGIIENIASKASIG
jgi:rod shape determining protein RodA